MEMILEVLIVLFCRYPGALIRWVFLHKRRTFGSLLKDDPYINATLSIAMLGGVALLISYIFKR